MKHMKLNAIKQSYKIIISFIIGFLFAIIFLKIIEVFQISEDVNSKNIKPFSYNLAVTKASPAVVNIFSEQLLNSRISKPRQNKDSIFGDRKNQTKSQID